MEICPCGKKLISLGSGFTICENETWPHAWRGYVGLQEEAHDLALLLRDRLRGGPPVDGRKSFCYEDLIYNSGECTQEVTPDHPHYASLIQRLAAKEITLIAYPEPSVASLGREGFEIYETEKKRLEQIKENRAAGAKKAAATRRNKSKQR